MIRGNDQVFARKGLVRKMVTRNRPVTATGDLLASSQDRGGGSGRVGTRKLGTRRVA